MIDPIDGTACFVNQMPSWCISIALVVKGEIQLALIYQPCGNELFSAKRGEGAFANGEPIKASEAKTVGDGLMGLGMSYRTKSDAITPFIQDLLDREGIFIRNGSGALMLAYAAAGRLIGYYEPHINPWDCLAGILLMQEAGGWTNDYLGAPDALENGAPILTAGPNVAEELRSMTGING